MDHGLQYRLKKGRLFLVFLEHEAQPVFDRVQGEFSGNLGGFFIRSED